jgi:hypothetical protein
MTLRTVTFNPATHKVVPVEPNDAMQVAGAQAIRFDTTVLNKLWTGNAVCRAMLFEVPDTLPGVIEHSGEPVAWIDEVGQLVVLEKFIKQHIGYVYEGSAIPEAWQPLFTHPAPAQPDHLNDVVKLVAQPVERQELSDAAGDVLAERRRQVERKYYDTAHDDEHPCGEIAALATYYAMPPAARDWPATETGYGETWGEAIIPADWTVSKSGDRRRELVKAGALILAEIERMDRAKDREQA